MTNPRDPRLRRQPAFPGVDVATAAVRLEVAAEAMRATARDHGPAPDALTRLLEASDAGVDDRAAVEAHADALVAELERWDAAAAVPEPEQPVDAPVEVEVEYLDREDPVRLPAPAAELPPPVTPTAPAPAPAPLEVPAAFSSERRTLDWHSRHDPRSLDFGVRGRLPGSAPIVDHMWPVGGVLDQRAEGACVGFAIADAINARTAGDVDLDDTAALELYRRAQQLDEVPGVDYTGTSVLAGLKAAQERGLIGGYLWAFGTRDVAQAVLQRGPVVVGVPWLSGMYDTGPGGLVELAGDDDGQGHALAVVGIRLKGPQGQPGPYFVWLNSWGPSYGDGGLGYIHHRDLAELLHGVGEAAIPTVEAQT